MENRTDEKRKNTYIPLIICASLAIIFTISMLIYFKTNITVSKVASKEAGIDYEKEYALITRDTSDDFWVPVYERMRYYGDRNNVYVQWMGKNITNEYSWKELMEIAVKSNVNGIIVEADDSDECHYWIGKAVSAGIPVVTVRTDSQLSNRISYVGVSYYNLGTEYGNLILSAASEILENRGEDVENPPDDKEDMIDVLVLMNKDTSDTTQNTILLAIREQLNKDDNLAGRIEVIPHMIDNSNDFSTEESIQDLLKSPTRDDIIICLSETNTVSVYEALVEQNRVGDILVIGYSDSDTILKAIQKNIIYASITADVDQLGKSCIEALDEFSEYGRVSDYYSVNFTVINSSNVQKFLRKEVENETK